MKSYRTPVLEVNICADLASVDVMHDGHKVTIMRKLGSGAFHQSGIFQDFAKMPAILRSAQRAGTWRDHNR